MRPGIPERAWLEPSGGADPADHFLQDVIDLGVARASFAGDAIETHDRCHEGVERLLFDEQRHRQPSLFGEILPAEQLEETYRSGLHPSFTLHRKALEDEPRCLVHHHQHAHFLIIRGDPERDRTTGDQPDLIETGKARKVPVIESPGPVALPTPAAGCCSRRRKLPCGAMAYCSVYRSLPR